jgi:S1-C subfamily serine protease
MISALLFALLLLPAADWPTLLQQAKPHVPRLEMRKGDESGICSAVVFEIDADGYATALTAAHCVDKQPGERLDLTVNGRTGVVLHSNSLLDLAIIRFRAKNDTAIDLAPDEPPAGSEVAIIGYAFGVDEPVAQFGHIAQSYNKETRTTWVNADLIFGDSGGLLVNAQGQLVGINSRIYSGGPLGQMAHIGAVVTVTQIRDYLDAYQAMKKAKK